jgi:hypothetical protein
MIWVFLALLVLFFFLRSGVGIIWIAVIVGAFIILSVFSSQPPVPPRIVGRRRFIRRGFGRRRRFRRQRRNRAYSSGRAGGARRSGGGGAFRGGGIGRR